MEAPNLIGQKYGMLTVIERAPNTKTSRAQWKCICDCGHEHVVLAKRLRSGHTKSCGCLQGFDHGHKGTLLNWVWKGMRQRCNNPKHASFKNYGGRGIMVCERWYYFPNFLEDMGPTYKEGLTLDRIDNDGDYCPGNCQWIPHAENSRKSRRAKITMDIAEQIRRDKLPTAELAVKYNLCKSAILGIKRRKTWV